MKSEALKHSEIEESAILKPNFHLNIGKRSIACFVGRGLKAIPLVQFVKEIYSGGIFKRVFVSDINAGIPYISAQHMMLANPKDYSKLISKKYTPRQNDMILKENTILMSCAGTVGNIRLIDKSFANIIGSQDIIRIIPNLSNYGYVYAYLSSKICYNYIQSLIYGSVVPRIEPNAVGKIPIPILTTAIQEEIHTLILEAVDLRVEANRLLEDAKSILKKETILSDLTMDNYEYFGPHSKRDVMYFVKRSKNIDATTINAFNHSKRISDTIQRVKSIHSLPLEDVLDNKKLFSTGPFPRIEVEKGIKLINQSDIFNVTIKGKNISRRKVRTDNLTEYGEVLLAGVGTLGENETFCRVIYANEDLEGQLVSGEFIRMKTNEKVPSGYLYTWLSTDYGFRFIRSTQTGTKLCRPIQKLLLKIPVPILEKEIMKDIHEKTVKAYTMRYNANIKESQAIQLIEKEIDSWQQS